MGLPAGISGPKRQALKIMSLHGRKAFCPRTQATTELVGLGADEGGNFKIILIIGEVFMAGVMRTAARLAHNLTLEQIGRTIAVFIVPALHLGAAR